MAKSRIRFRFDGASPEAIEWAKKHAGELAEQISETSHDAIKRAIADLLVTGDFEQAREEILEAVGDETRADLIVRHETMVAVSEGQRQAWDQAVDKGLLSGDEKRTWLVVGDDKVCPECEALDGTVADLQGTYPGDVIGPPLHPRCRCTEGIT